MSDYQESYPMAFLIIYISGKWIYRKLGTNFSIISYYVYKSLPRGGT